MTRAERNAARSAYHEAGHAVVALRLGHRIGPVTLLYGKKREGHFRRLGHTRVYWSDPRWGGDPAVLLAGYYAEKRRFPSAHWLGSASGDYGALGRALNLLYGPSTDANRNARAKMERLWERGAREIVKDPKVWASIELLAAELLKRKTLSGRTVRTLVEPNLRMEPLAK